MGSDETKIRVAISRELIAEVDQLAGHSERSAFVIEAVREKLARMRLSRTAEEVAGSLEDVTIPGWETSEDAARWVRSLRETDDH